MTKRIGVALREAQAAIQIGPLRRSTPKASAATMSGWTFPREAMRIRKPPRSAAKAALARLRRDSTGRTTKAYDAWGVGGGYERVATTSLQRAIGCAQSHPFGVGDAFHNYGTRGAWAETVFPGFWPRWVFDRVGYFDERMLYNEDNEFSHRIRSAGGRLWYEPSLRIRYSPRKSVGGLFRQYFRYGHGKAAVFREHPDAVRFRHLVPAALVAVLIAGPLLTPLVPAIGFVTAAVGVRVPRGCSRCRTVDGEAREIATVDRAGLRRDAPLVRPRDVGRPRPHVREPFMESAGTCVDARLRRRRFDRQSPPP